MKNRPEFIKCKSCDTIVATHGKGPALCMRCRDDLRERNRRIREEGMRRRAAPIRNLT